MIYHDIAVIGMSGRFARSETLERLRENLINKQDCISKITPERLDLMNLDPAKDYMEIGQLENVEFFDHEFFGISSREANLMSPEQRISLELATEAILNAGYSLQDFRGTNCSVFFTSSENSYGRLVDKTTSSSILGSKEFMIGSRIAYHLDLQGPNMIYDAGCASSLAAVHETCIKLMIGETDYGLVGGIQIFTEIAEAKKHEYDILGLLSKDYRSKSFDENADGTSTGEGGGCILLKRLSDAQRDGDYIYGIIKSGAVNCDGGRCSSVTMPSVQAQKEVMLKAWEGIDVSALTDFEAHGIGNPIGDSVEATSIIENLQSCGVNSKEIKLGSLKTNIGHLYNASGIAGLIKVFLGYKYKESYPMVHFNKPHPLINFDNSPLKPLQETYHWNANDKRLTGIDAFGLGGTNAHLIVENFVSEEKHEKQVQKSLVKFSAKSEEAFYLYKKRLCEYLKENSHSVNNIIYTLNSGRDDYSVRRMIYVYDEDDFYEKLDMLCPVNISNTYKIFFVLKAENFQNQTLDLFNDSKPGFEDYYKIITQNADVDYKCAMYKYCRLLGVVPDKVLADTQGRAIINYVSGKCSESDLKKAVDEPVNNNYDKLIEQINNSSKTEEIIVLDFGLSGKLKNIKWPNKVQIFETASVKDMEKFLQLFYNSGNNINWKAYYGKSKREKVPLPGYCFEKVYHWLQLTKKPEDQRSISDHNKINIQREKSETVKQEQKQSEPVHNSEGSQESLSRSTPKIIFAMKTETISDREIEQYTMLDFLKNYEEITEIPDINYKFAMYKCCISKGIKPDVVLADIQSRTVIDFIAGKCDKEELMRISGEPVNDNYDKLIENIKKLGEKGNVIVVDFGHNSRLSKEVWSENIKIFELSSSKDFEKLDNISEFKESNEQENKSKNEIENKIENIKETTLENPLQKPDISDQVNSDIAEVENFLEKLWVKTLNFAGKIDHDEDFFYLGGNSLLIQQMSDEINSHFNINFDIYEIYDYETIEKLAQRIMELI